MKKMQRTKKRVKRGPDWSHCKTYTELKAFVAKHSGGYSGEENLSIMERMRQLRYGYEPGTLRMDKTKIRSLTMQEFRKESEHEYAAEIKKYGPR
ncbi:MAG TPA: hypothetical protein VGN88_06925 [Phycisphaerae bacterium]|jgi:hypothetical protein